MYLERMWNVQLTNIARGAHPARAAFATERAAVFAAGAAVLAGRRGARIVHHLAVGAREAVRTPAQIVVGGRVLAGAAIHARLMGAAIVQVCK